MPNSMKLLAFLVFLGISSKAFSTLPSFSLTENKLKELASKGSPKLDEIEAMLLGAQLGLSQAREQFSAEAYAQGSYAETKERALIAFQPIMSPTKSLQVGVRQNFKYGISADLGVAAVQQSGGSPFAGNFNDVTTTVLTLTTQIDLWRDLFGRMSKAALDNAGIESKRAQIENEIQKKTFEITVRKLYWTLVANEESLKISENLLKTAKTQAEESRKRLVNSIAEEDEVARYEAQVAQREGSIIYLKYQREALLKQLKNLLPELSQYELNVGAYDLGNTVTEVLLCTATIAGQPSVPYDFTKYDDVISLTKEVKGNLARANSRYADVDVKLFGTFKSTGIGSQDDGNGGFKGSYSDSFKDQRDHNRTGYEVGLALTIPLGDAKKTSQTTKEIYDQKRLDASIDNAESTVVNTHYQLVKSIGLLTEVVKTQRKNSSLLEKRLKLMSKKYNQARVSVDDLINDQDALLNSELTTINTQLEILNTLFDYLVVFTETPCTFNRK